MREIWVWSLGQEDLLEKEIATHPSILAWRIPWREELGGLQSMGSQSAGHDWMTNTFLVLPARAVDRQIHIQTRLVYSSDTLKWILSPSIQSETVLGRRSCVHGAQPCRDLASLNCPLCRPISYLWKHPKTQPWDLSTSFSLCLVFQEAGISATLRDLTVTAIPCPSLKPSSLSSSQNQHAHLQLASFQSLAPSVFCLGSSKSQSHSRCFPPSPFINQALTLSQHFIPPLITSYLAITKCS